MLFAAAIIVRPQSVWIILGVSAGVDHFQIGAPSYSKYSTYSAIEYSTVQYSRYFEHET